jgi:hypothetical protein
MGPVATKPASISFTIFNHKSNQLTKIWTANIRKTAINYIFRPQEPMCDKPAIGVFWVMRKSKESHHLSASAWQLLIIGSF